MNSVDKYLTAESKIATLLAMRSAKKEIFFVVEGDTDVSVVCHVLGIPASNILSCNGKEILDKVYLNGFLGGLDEGVIFLRDRDHDRAATGVKDGILLLVTDYYDIEMELLNSRLFSRILSEYRREILSDDEVAAVYTKIATVASYLGALRLHSQVRNLGLDFDDLKSTKFFDANKFQLDLVSLLKYIYAKSKVSVYNLSALSRYVDFVVKKCGANVLVCGKDFLEIFHLALYRYYDVCKSSECSPELLGKIIRISANQDDLRTMTLYHPLVNHVQSNKFAWTGNPL